MRSLRSLAVVSLAVLCGCAPATAGPEVPRPLGPSATVTTSILAPSTTTTIDPLEVMATSCPRRFCLVYEITAGARWSNGDPVAPADFVHTAELLSQPLVEAPSEGYGLIDTIDVIDETRFRVVFERPFGGWEQMFDRLIPVAGDPHDLTTLATTGAFRLVEWVPGDRIVIRRDPQWWSRIDPITEEPLGTVGEVTFVFPPDVPTMLDSLEEGTVDVISLRPDLEAMERVAGMTGVTYAVAPGPFWEHIDFNHTDPVLSQPWARQAISLAIDREALLDRTVRLFDAGSEGLGNTVWMQNTAVYEDHHAHRYDPEAAAAILADNGCVPDGDGVLVCGETRMSFLWASTDDDPARFEVFEAVRDQLAAVGIEVVPAFRSPSQFVTRDFLFGGPEAWQIIQFAWRAAPDPAAQNAVYVCGDTQLNVNRFCSEQVTDLIRSTEQITDPAERAAAYNEADRIYLESLPLVPLYQRPDLMAWRTEIGGPEPNWSHSTDMWNLTTWFGPRSIVVALPSEPVVLDPLVWSDEAANSVLATLLYGAFGSDPAHSRHPVLISSVEIVEGSG